MKKICIFAACVLFCGLTACGSADKKIDTLPENFSVTAQIQDGELDTSALLTRIPEGWEVEITAPEKLEGMKFEITEADCLLTYGELSYSLASETMLDSSPVMLTTRALDKCVRSESEGTIDGEPYLVTLKDGKPQNLRVGTVSAKFSGFKEK